LPAWGGERSGLVRVKDRKGPRSQRGKRAFAIRNNFTCSWRGGKKGVLVFKGGKGEGRIPGKRGGVSCLATGGTCSPGRGDDVVTHQRKEKTKKKAQKLPGEKERVRLLTRGGEKKYFLLVFRSGQA